MVLIKDAEIINEGCSFTGSVLIDGERISKVLSREIASYQKEVKALEKISETVIDGSGLTLLPGVIDTHVHFREPGQTSKGDIESESAAAVLGGVTSYMDMPNNNPPACTLEQIEVKNEIAAQRSYANYSFYLGADNSNISEILACNPKEVCGIKVFMGSSTGGLLVENDKVLEDIFSKSPILVAVHCEDDSIIRQNLARTKERYGTNVPFWEHSTIRSSQECIKASEKAINLALKHQTRLHILHISTQEELTMLRNAKMKSKKITGEACVNYFWFDNSDCIKLKGMVKCNPSLKGKEDKVALYKALNDKTIDTVGTDHAPHLPSEKQGEYLSVPSGIPSIQFSLQMMIQLSLEGAFPPEAVVHSMCHAPAECFDIKERGYIREGYYADLVLVKIAPQKSFYVSKDNIAYKCKWSPLEGESFHSSILYTFVNGSCVVSNGELTGARHPMKLLFDR